MLAANFPQDAPQTTSDDGVGTDPRQLENAYVLREQAIDPSYIIGSKPGVCTVNSIICIY